MKNKILLPLHFSLQESSYLPLQLMTRLLILCLLLHPPFRHPTTTICLLTIAIQMTWLWQTQWAHFSFSYLSFLHIQYVHSAETHSSLGSRASTPPVFPPILLPTFLRAFHRQSSPHLLSDGMLQNSLLGHFLFSFHICLDNLIYFHVFSYYLLLITSKSTFLVLAYLMRFSDMTFGCLASSVL